MLLFTFFLSLFALPTAHHTEFLRRIHTPNRPEVLVVISPGWDEEKLNPLLEHLWLEGFSVWSLRFADHAQDLEQMSQSLTTALSTHTNPIVIVHGLSSIVLFHTPKFNSTIRGYAFLGSPLKAHCSPRLKEALRTDKWNDYPHLPLRHASHTFHQLVYTWCTEKKSTRQILDAPYIWSATTNAHPIAPPESIRPYLGIKHRFVRSGPLALHGREPSPIQLGTHKPTLNDLSKWLWKNKPWKAP